MARTKAGMVPRLQHHKRSGQGRVHLSGRDFYCGKWGTQACKAAYDRLIAEWLHNGRRPPQQTASTPIKTSSQKVATQIHPHLITMRLDPAARHGGDEYLEKTSTPTLGLRICQVALMYMESCEVYYRDKDGRRTSTFDNSKQAVTALEPYDDLPATSFGPKKLQEMRALLVQQGRPRKTCNTIVKSVKRLFRWAESQELVSPGTLHALNTVEPLKRGRTTAAERPPVKPVAEEVIEATIKHAPRVVADMVRVHRLVGGRSTEICLMRPCDLDCSGTVWEYRPSRHKTDYLEGDEEKVIAIGPKAQAVLKPYLDRSPEEYLFSPRESEEERHRQMRLRRKSKVQPSQQNRRTKNPKRFPRDRYDRDSYRRAVQRAAELAKVEKWTPHQLRHTNATEVRKRYGIEAAQVILGHKDPKVTQIYAERNLELARKVALALG
jgi:integrase